MGLTPIAAARMLKMKISTAKVTLKKFKHEELDKVEENLKETCIGKDFVLK